MELRLPRACCTYIDAVSSRLEDNNGSNNSGEKINERSSYHPPRQIAVVNTRYVFFVHAYSISVVDTFLGRTV